MLSSGKDGHKVWEWEGWFSSRGQERPKGGERADHTERTGRVSQEGMPGAKVAREKGLVVQEQRPVGLVWRDCGGRKMRSVGTGDRPQELL